MTSILKRRIFYLPVFEDTVGNVDAHDGVDNEKDKNWKIKPDKLVQLAIEKAGPKNLHQVSELNCETFLLPWSSYL